MGAHLHGGHLGAGGQGRRQLGLQLIGKCSCVFGGVAMAGPAIHQGAEEGRRPAGLGGQVFDQAGGGGFAVGAGNADQAHRLAGLPPEGRRQAPGPGGQRIGHHQHRIFCGGGPLGGGGGADHRRHGPGGQGLWPEAAPIHPAAGQTNKQAAGLHKARITAHLRYRLVLKVPRGLQSPMAQEGMELLGHGPTTGNWGLSKRLDRRQGKSAPPALSLQPEPQALPRQPGRQAR